MPQYVFVPGEYSGWLRKAREFAKRDSGSLAGTGAAAFTSMVRFLEQNQVPHGHTDSRDNVPAGSHYQQAG